MKNKFKSLIAIAMLALTLQAKAGEVLVNLSDGLNTIWTNTSTFRVTELQFIAASTGTGVVKVYLYDNSTSTNTITTAYITRSSYTTNIVTSVTDSLGNVNSRTNYGIFTYTNTVAASTNQAAKVAVFLAAATSDTTKTVNLTLVRGLSAHADVGGATGILRVVYH